MSKMPRIKHDNLHRYSIQMAENISSMTYGMFTHLNEDNDFGITINNRSGCLTNSKYKIY